MKNVIIVLVGILLFTGCHKTTSNSTIKINGTYVANIDNYIIYKDNDKLGVKTLDGKKIIEPKYQELVSNSSHKSLVFKSDGNYIIIDNKGKEVIKSKNKIEIITDKMTGRDYYYVNKSIYNDKYQLLIDNLSLEQPINMYNGFIIINNDRVIDIRTRNYMNISFVDAYKDYTAFSTTGSYLVYDHEHETWLSYKNHQPLLMGSVFSKDNDKIYINHSKGKVNNVRDLIDSNGLLQDEYTIDINTLTLLKKNDNKELLSKPLKKFSVSSNKKIYYFESIDSNVAVINNQVIPVGKSTIIGDYLYDEINHSIYSSSGKKVDKECSNFVYLKENYSCNNSILNNELKEIDTYTGLNCKNDTCSIKNNEDLYGVYKKNKVIVKPVYKKIDIHKEYYIGVIDDKTFELVYYKDIKDN